MVRFFDLRAPRLNFIEYSTLSREIYGGISMIVAGVAFINVCALSNVSLLFFRLLFVPARRSTFSHGSVRIFGQEHAGTSGLS